MSFTFPTPLFPKLKIFGILIHGIEFQRFLTDFRRHSNENNLLKDHSKVEFTRIDLVLQRRLCQLSSPNVKFPLHKASKILNSLFTTTPRFKFLTIVNYCTGNGSSDSHSTKIEDISIIVMNSLGIRCDIETNYLMYNFNVSHVKTLWLSPEATMFITEVLPRMKMLTRLKMENSTVRQIISPSKFEEIVEQLGQLPNLEDIRLCSLQIPEKWENLFLKHLKNKNLKSIVVSHAHPVDCQVLYNFVKIHSNDFKISINYQPPYQDFSVFDEYFDLLGINPITGEVDKYNVCIFNRFYKLK